MSNYEDILRDKFRGCIVGGAIGDALGAPLEGMNSNEIRKYFPNGVKTFERPPEEYWRAKQPDRLNIHPGQYTDDTQATMAVAVSLINNKGFDGNAMASELSKIDYRFAGKNSLNGIKRYKEGMLWNKSGSLDADTNGSVMRVSPIALFYHNYPESMRKYASDSSLLTHRNPLCQTGCRTIGTMVAHAVKNEVPINEIGNMFSSENPTPQMDDFKRKISGVFEHNAGRLLSKEERSISNMIIKESFLVTNIVPQAIEMYTAEIGNFKTSVSGAVNMGGDTDTRGSLTGAMAGAYVGLKKIPKEWTEEVEGLTTLIDIADGLFDTSMETERFFRVEVSRRVPVKEEIAEKRKHLR